MIEPELVRRLEAVEIASWEALYLAAAPDFAAEAGLHLERLDRALLSAASHIDVLAFNRVIGLGVASPAGEAVVARVVERYRGLGVTRFFVQHCPYAEPPELPELLRAHGLEPYNHWIKLYRDARTVPEPETDFRIEAVSRDRAMDFGGALAENFEWPAILGRWVAQTVGAPGWYHYVAYAGVRPVGTAALFIRDRIGEFAMASTAPEARGRGIQTALILRRIRDAAALGCTTLQMETLEDLPERPAPSYRNALRAGFQPAYRRANWIWRAAA
ncbi:MAG TPA: GNAT family N-acetyltransferase [Gemmatimonadales bacterium]|jgi:GNAT superfamily N-acetyltransferase|nr:GNAT family N-acetyltransferase [Gemmatimonadales bacterium]